MDPDRCHCPRCEGDDADRLLDLARLDRHRRARDGRPGATAFACGHVVAHERGYTGRSALRCFACYLQPREAPDGC